MPKKKVSFHNCKSVPQKIKETEKAAYMRGTPDYTDEKYEESREEKTAQRKLKRLKARLDKLENK